jgi:hypothetical protein
MSTTRKTLTGAFAAMLVGSGSLLIAVGGGLQLATTVVPLGLVAAFGAFSWASAR